MARIWLRRSLPGDSDELRSALHQLAARGLLPPNPTGSLWTDLCPRCGRETAVGKPPALATVCASCRAEYLVDHAPQVAAWNAHMRTRDQRKGK
jgi:hypothetical protein